MSLPFSSIALRLPAGFQNLLEGLALEVLRAQPADVVAFAAQHFQTLLEQREGEWPCPAPPIPAPHPLPVPRGVAPVMCAHHPGRQACPVCPSWGTFPSPCATSPALRAHPRGVRPAPCAHPMCHQASFFPRELS